MRRRYKYILAFILIAIFAMTSPFLWRNALQSWYGNDIHTLNAAPQEDVAIVFGARVYPSGRLSAMLRDRVETAVKERPERGLAEDGLFETFSDEDLLRTGLPDPLLPAPEPAAPMLIASICAVDWALIVAAPVASTSVLLI